MANTSIAVNPSEVDSAHRVIQLNDDKRKHQHTASMYEHEQPVRETATVQHYVNKPLHNLAYVHQIQNDVLQISQQLNRFVP